MRDNPNNVEKRFASWLKQTIDLVAPKNLKLVAGRGTAKTSDILADRSIDVVYDMPRAMFALVSDTYVNSLTNIVPTLIEGWRERKGWIEGVHYVTDERPPDHFDIPYKPIINYKHTISVFNGCFFNLGSMDRVSSLAGNSYQHIFGDEAKYLNPEKLKKLMPALRGYVDFAHSPYYRGVTFTTDMPNILEGDYDWILKGEDEMDKKQIEMALQAGFVVNEIRQKIKWLYDRNRQDEIKKEIKNLERWTERWMRARKDSTFFYMVSSFVNADILQPGYFKDSLTSLGIEEFKASILSLKPSIKKGENFYGNLAPYHFLDDGVDNDYVDKYLIKDNYKPDCSMLKYLDKSRSIDAGLDFGNMISMVIGQERGAYNYVLKNIHVLAPQSTKDLAKRFIDFFEPHSKKVLNLWYDRSGNQYSQIKRDWASEIKNHIEKYDGKSTGWKVNLMSKGQKTIYQEEEYIFMKKFMGKYYDKVPNLRICRSQCKELKSSLELTKIKTKHDTKGSTTIHKDKTSEKLEISKLPMFSTNYSDAFKYYLMRKKYVKLVDNKISVSYAEPEVY